MDYGRPPLRTAPVLKGGGLGDFNREGRPAPGPAFDLDFAVKSDHHLFDDGKAETRSLGIFSRAVFRVRGLLVFVEYLFQIGRLDPDAAVRNGQRDSGPAGKRLEIDLDLSLLRKPDGVA